jgi:hypothetical protein
VPPSAFDQDQQPRGAFGSKNKYWHCLSQQPKAGFLACLKSHKMEMELSKHLAPQVLDMLDSMRLPVLPENVRTSVAESLGKARQTHASLVAAAKESIKAAEEVMLTTQSGARALGDKVLSNTMTNIETYLETAEAIARAKTLPAAVELQTKFIREQLAAGSEQARELFQLSMTIARQANECLNVAATSALAQFKDVR